MAEKKPLTQSKAYSAFIHDRDIALDSIHAKYQIALAQIVTVLQERAEEIAAHMSTKQHGRQFAKLNRDSFQRRLEPYFQMAIEQAHSLFKQLRTTTYTLSYAGQAEAIGRALDKNTRGNLSKSDVNEEMERETPSGGNTAARVELAFHRLLRDIVDAFQLSQVLESPAQETMDRIDRAFPSKARIPKRIKMAQIKEAAKPKDEEPGISMSFGIIEPDVWDQAVEDYTQAYLPFGRSPNDKIFYPVDWSKDDQTDYIQGYSWELEQEMMDDFVQSVREGESDSAEENGIMDYQWIAIIDSKTDNCCMVRDGLNSTEIRKKLDNGEDMGDCDAEVPPAHFHCRCRTAPMTEDMISEKPEIDFEGFDNWLQQKGNME